MDQSESQVVEGREKKDKIVLCTAEAYGFGPAAALWSIYTRLRPRLPPDIKWHYVGCRHSLSLHVDRVADPVNGWDVVHKIDVVDEGGPAALNALFGQLQPLLFVALVDPAASAVAVEAGVPLVVVDPILWWFPELPAAWHKAELVLAADFFGVHERVKRENLTKALVVPPLAPTIEEGGSTSREGVVINLGGLRNPLSPASLHIDYAHLIYECAREAVDRQRQRTGRSIPLRIWGSPEIVQNLPQGVAVTVTPGQAHAGMRQAALVCITPGLGNLFDAAVCAGDVLLLPPTNDTQGLQAAAVVRALNTTSISIDWHSLIPQQQQPKAVMVPLDYNKPMTQLTDDIASAVYFVRDSHEARARLSDIFGSAIERAFDDAANAVDTVTSPSDLTNITGKMTNHQTLRPLISKFGSDDGTMMAAAIADLVVRRLDLTR